MRLKTRTAEAPHVEVPSAGNSATDSEIARRARVAVAWHTHSPDAAINVQVTNGRVTLTGSVEDAYERWDIEAALKKLDGVAKVSNLIEIEGAPQKVLVRAAG
jgi:osmotically-inducible protein OsmY